jgi:uncharacterized protein (DUF433 family)
MVATMKAPDDIKFTEPLYTVTEASRYLGVPLRTFWEWVHGQDPSQPLISGVGSPRRGEPVVSFIGLSEGLVLQGFRKAGLSLQYVRKALRALQEDATQAGIDARYALASQRLYKHGARVLVDYDDEEETRRFFELVSKNMVFTPVVEGHLERITYGEDGWASSLILPATRSELVRVDPLRAAGQPLTIRGGARVVDIIDRFRGGEAPEFIGRDFGVPSEDVIELIRAFYTPQPGAA